MAEMTETRHGRQLVLGRLGVGSLGKRGVGWWGMLSLITTEAFLFGYLLFSYYYMAVQYGRDWIPELPSFRLSGPNTAILIVSSIFVWLGERSVRRGGRWGAFAGVVVGLALGIVFVAIQYREWMDKPFGLASSSYGSLFFTVTGFHMAHVLAGLLMLAPLALWTALGYFDGERHAPFSIVAIYWHFVDAVWLTVFFTFYVTPYLM